ncbi:J domain-containing protein [Candidatus Methylobacter oryzae]|uniref:J domain-containing protein n=1 Tax=Candidatus Methylobacter oryzae TaxID=2497749 RepID=A0ABY3C4T9_9GAMM|nr:J domain-containing protein [Candidatus Methylobacter oryzae]TRW89755.1 J domain-containing protein [Candidatus Methylobacter oryzae]
MAQSNSKTVRITPKTAEKKPLSTAQKQFNSLTKKIDLQKKLLVEWKETIPLYHQQVEQEYEPLQDALTEHKSQWTQLLDRFYGMPLFKKTDKQKIKHLICEISGDLIAEFNKEELKPLFNKYSDEDYDTIDQETNAAAGDMMKMIAENMFNVDLDDDVDLSSPEKLHAHLQQKLSEQHETQAKAPVKERKKTKKQLEKEARQQEEEALASKSVQEVYRKLVAVLHPDREPDEQQRERKTELMQRVNTAYGKKDLLQLLELQLEIEQIDPTHLSQIADSRLKYFNKILKEQLAELEQENDQIASVFKMDLNMPFYIPLSPKQLMLMLKNDIRALQENIKAVQSELEVFENPAEFKAWLKNYKIPKRTARDDLDDLLFGGMMPFDFR